MNKSIFIVISAIAILAISTQQTHALTEDLSYICKTGKFYGNNDQLDNTIKCTIVKDTQVFSNEGLDTIDTQFKYNLDVFDSLYLGQID